MLLSDSHEIGTHNHLVRKQTLNYLAKLAKLFSFVASTFLAVSCITCVCIMSHTPLCTTQITTHNTAQYFGQFG